MDNNRSINLGESISAGPDEEGIKTGLIGVPSLVSSYFGRP